MAKETKATAVDKAYTKKYALAILGTGSNVGKSFLVTAFCSYFAAVQKNNSEKFRVAPFKAQNMSNNSMVVAGGEIGHAQFVQAQAARALPCCDMNPILLKPLGEKKGSQLIVNGKPQGNFSALEYYRKTHELFHKTKQSFKRLQERYDIVIIEGAGSCAEVNLRKKDFTNFKIAAFGKAPVLLVANIEQGGVFAQVLGSLHVMSKQERKAVKGILINRFRGDPELFADGVKYIEKKSKLPVLGVIPWLDDIFVEAEDSFSLDETNAKFVAAADKHLSDGFEQDGIYKAAQENINNKEEQSKFKVVVIRLPTISNFNDFSVFAKHPLCSLQFLRKPCDLSNYDLVILPGSKNVRADADWLQQQGWDFFLQERAKQEKHVHGICGGLQILGESIEDPWGVEGCIGTSKGLALLPFKTVLQKQKSVSRVSGEIEADLFSPEVFTVQGYEIHAGKTSLLRPCARFCTIRQREQKLLSATEIYADGYWNGKNILASYLHGLYESQNFLQQLIIKIRPDLKEKVASIPLSFKTKVQSYNELGQRIARYVDMKKLKKIMGI